MTFKMETAAAMHHSLSGHLISSCCHALHWQLENQLRDKVELTSEYEISQNLQIQPRWMANVLESLGQGPWSLGHVIIRALASNSIPLCTLGTGTAR